MSHRLALLVERDPALRQLMSRALAGAGYEVRECSTALQLQVELHTLRSNLQPLLLVSSVAVAIECRRAIAATARSRSSRASSRLHILFTREFGHDDCGAPEIEGCRGVGVLEKPFDLDELEKMAQPSSATMT